MEATPRATSRARINREHPVVTRHGVRAPDAATPKLRRRPPAVLDTTGDFAELVLALLGVAAKLERRRIAERPVARAGEIVVRKIGYVSVTFDHRVVDGARAAEFGLAVIDRLQSPVS